jgi:hypothetical protein
MQGKEAQDTAGGSASNSQKCYRDSSGPVDSPGARFLCLLQQLNRLLHGTQQYLTHSLQGTCEH